MVKRMVRRQSRAVPAAVAAQIKSAPAPQLEAWLDRLVDGASMQELFNTK